jgi:hypothetical protein
VELPGVEPGSETVYRSSVYVRIHRLKFRLKPGPVKGQLQTIPQKNSQRVRRKRVAASLFLSALRLSAYRQAPEGTAGCLSSQLVRIVVVNYFYSMVVD